LLSISTLLIDRLRPWDKIEKIEALQNIPEALRQIARQKLLVSFIGAGVSQLGGCPDWNGFSNAALNFFVQKEKFSHAQLDQVSLLSSRVKLSLALDMQEQHNLFIDFKALPQIEWVD